MCFFSWPLGKLPAVSAYLPDMSTPPTTIFKWT